jgi:hypothetical protein
MLREYEETCHAQRTSFEVTENQQREMIYGSEKDERIEDIYLAFHSGKIALMVERSLYQDSLREMEHLTASNHIIVQDLENELLLVQNAKTKLEEELAEIRIEQKRQARSIPIQMKELEESMAKALADVINSFEQQKIIDNNTVMQNFNFQFGHNKQLYLDLLYEVESRVRHYSHVLAESKSVHSNLPPRIRKLLEERSKEEILFMIDTLSYEESVLGYFETKYPKESVPRWPTTSTRNAYKFDEETDT